MNALWPLRQIAKRHGLTFLVQRIETEARLPDVHPGQELTRQVTNSLVYSAADQIGPWWAQGRRKGADYMAAVEAIDRALAFVRAKHVPTTVWLDQGSTEQYETLRGRLSVDTKRIRDWHEIRLDGEGSAILATVATMLGIVDGIHPIPTDSPWAGHYANPRRNRMAETPIQSLAVRDGLTALAAWIGWNENAMLATIRASTQIVAAAPEARTAAKRRIQAFAALAVLRKAQAEAAKKHGVLPLLSPEERATLATWSGLGGLFRSCTELKPEEIALLRPDQQEYCRLSGERALQKARGVSEAQLPQIPLDLTFSFEGMIAQYFTPAAIAERMCQRAVECWDATNDKHRPLRILEPSAGSGRMVQGWRRANLGDAQWMLVEWDKDQADLLELVYGVSNDFHIFAGPIEQYAAERPPTLIDNRVDLVIANPPYADRRVGSKKADPPYKDIKENQNYFVLRSLDYLRPRGVTIQLVPWGILTDPRGEDARVRAEILKRAHFFGAVELPSDVFPGSLQNVVLMVLGKRPVRLDAVLAEDQAIADGKWLRRPVPEGPEGPHMGHVDPSSKHYRGGVLRTGAFDYDKLVEFTNREPPKSYFAEVKETPAVVAATKAVRNDRLGISVAEVTRIGELLGSRCIALREARVQNAERARGLIAELRPDLEAFAARFGNPRTAKLPPDYRPGGSWYALVSAYNADGSFSDLIGTEVAGPVSSYQGDGTPADAVRFVSARNGYATQEDVESVLGHRIDAKELLFHPDVFWSPEAREIGLCYYRSQEYLSGTCWERMEWCRSQRDAMFAYSWPRKPKLSADETNTLAERASLFADALIAAIAPKPMNDIDIGIRSEWVYDPVAGEADTLDAGILLEWITATKAADRGSRWFSLDSLRVIKGRMVAEGTDLLDPMVQDVVAYYNRDEKIDKRSRGGQRSKGKRNTDDLSGRLKADQEKDEKFRAFVQNHARAMEIATRYNRQYRGFVARRYDESPMPLARFNPEDAAGNRVTVRPYIWAAVRRAVDRRGGIMALDVGLGKTFAALLAAAAMRESGKARRIMVAVPNSVGPNWISEISRILPDYRILPIGFTPKMLGGKLRSTADDVDVITRKLADFAAGLYDVAIVQHSTLMRFGCSEERAKSLLSGRVSSSRAIAAERNTLMERAQEITDTKVLIHLLQEKARGGDQEARDDLDKAKAKLDQLTGADVEELNQKLQKLKAEVKGLDKQALIEGQESATTQKQLNDISAALLTFDEIAQVEHRIQKKLAVSEATIRNEVDDAIALESYIAERVPEPAVRGITFDELGVDLLIVDEAHQFKNLYGAASRYGQKLKYMGALDAEKVTAKCWDLLVKCLSVRDRNEGTGVLLLTATPLKNSPLEAYSLVSYCTEEAWSRRGIEGPESFIDRFCIGMPEPVLKVDGSFDYQLAVNRFTNLDELRAIFAEWVDVKAAMRRPEYEAMVNAGRTPGANIVPLDLPADQSVEHMIPMTQLVSDQYETIRAELAGDAEQSVGTLCEQATKGLSKEETELVKAGQVDLSALDEIEAENALPRAANPRRNAGGAKKGGEVLQAMDQMTKLATDVGLMGLHDPDAPIPLKYKAVAEEIRKSKAENGDCAHIVFSDYNETHSGLKAAIVAVANIPAERIKLVTGALSVGQRQQVVDGFNGTWDSKTKTYTLPPEFDVVIGNTPTMGEGLNLQQRACSIHHVTLPWEPASIQQRNGRGVRQGNRYDLVTVHYYLTERSFDGYKLSLIKGKRAWMVGLLESAAKTTNNPGASMGGPCAILRALAADPDAADKACQCLEAAGAIREIARRKTVALQDFAAYIGAFDASRRAREDDTRRYYVEQAKALRAKLERLGPKIFPYHDWLDRVSEVRALVIAATGRVFLEGTWYLLAGTASRLERIDLDAGTLYFRGISDWETTPLSTGDYRIRHAEIAPIDPPSAEEQAAALQGMFPHIYGKDTIRALTATAIRFPTAFKAGVADALKRGGHLGRLTIPTLANDPTGAVAPVTWTPEAYQYGIAANIGEILLPTPEDADRYLRAIRSLPRGVRVQRRNKLQAAYTEWFDRVYPKDLRDEAESSADASG